MYKVKHLKRSTGVALQWDISNWIETRDHVQIIQMNVWSDSRNHYATIIYTEKSYEL